MWSDWSRRKHGEAAGGGVGSAWLAAPRMPWGGEQGGSQGPQALCRQVSQIPDKELALSTVVGQGDQETWFCLSLLIPSTPGLSFSALRVV